MNVTAIKGSLGLAMRAGQLVTGVDFVLNEIRANKTKMVLIDAGASANTQKRIKDSCDHYGVDMYVLPQDILGEACGKENRMVASVKPGGFVQKFIKLLSTT